MALSDYIICLYSSGYNKQDSMRERIMIMLWKWDNFVCTYVCTNVYACVCACT